MMPMRAEDIYGNWGTLLLPVEKDDSINWGLLAEEIDYMIEVGVNGIYSNGTAGEFYNQTEEEFDRVSSLLAEKCEKAGVPFQLGVSHMSPVLSLERLKRVKALKPGAFQVILPDWFPVTQPEAVEFLLRMSAEAAPAGLILYNPPHAKCILSPEQLSFLQQSVPGLLGVKVAGGGEEWYGQMRELLKELSVFVAGHCLATGYSNGARGAYSNVACLSPAGAQKWYEQMTVDLPGALELESRIQKFMSVYIAPYITDRGFMNGAVDKLLCVIGGWSGMTPRMRWPYRWIAPEDAEGLRKTARALLPEMF